MLLVERFRRGLQRRNSRLGYHQGRALLGLGSGESFAGFLDGRVSRVDSGALVGDGAKNFVSGHSAQESST